MGIDNKQLDEKRYRTPKPKSVDSDEVSDAYAEMGSKEKKDKANDIPYGRSKSEQKDKKKLRTQGAKREGMKDKRELEEGKGASKKGMLRKGNTEEWTRADQNLGDANDDSDTTVKGRTGSKNKTRDYRDDKFIKDKEKRAKPKGSKFSDKRKGTSKLKESMMSEQMNDFVNAVARDDYSKTKGMLKDIVQSKLDQRTQQEVDKITAEQEQG